MQLSKLFTLSVGLLGAVKAQCCTPNVSYTTSSYQNYILDTYLDVWGGNYSLLNSTFAPDVHLYQDIIPSGVWNITNPSQYLAWMEHSRGGWTQFDIVKQFWFGNGYQIALRWNLDGIIGNISEHAPGSTVPNGSHITYNGTDILTLNPCTGLIETVESAQDFITFFKALGLKSVPT